MDFGLARAVEGSRLTQDGSSLGTPSYMAPEAIRGEPTAASDLFALGVMMHEMLAGRPPFGGDKPLAVLYNIMNERPRPLREARPDTPPAVASLVDRLLEKEAALRPDAATLARELAALTGAPPPRPEATTEELETRRLATGQALPSAAQLSSVRTRATTVALGADEAPTQAMEVPALPVPATAAPPAPPQRRRRAGVVFFGLLALALAAAAALVWFAMGRAGLERDRQEALALNNRGTERLRAGEVDSAVVLFEAALRRQPGFGPALVNLGVARHRRGETDAAVALLTQVLERHGRDSTLAAQAEFELGSIELDSGNPPVAVPHFERAVALEPGNPGYANNLAFALIQVGRPREAEDRIDRLLETYPNDPYLLKNKALALIELEREVEALPLLERAMRADATLPSPWGWRAVARAMGGDRAGATADWAAYLERGPSVDERTEIARRLTGLGVAPAAP
jgi:Flp pilus assembly protein TadD